MFWRSQKYTFAFEWFNFAIRLPHHPTEVMVSLLSLNAWVRERFGFDDGGLACYAGLMLHGP